MIIDGRKILDLRSGEPKIIGENSMANGVVRTPEISELQGSLMELNKDEFNTHNRTSDIDLRSRLHHLEITGILMFDTLVSFGFLPMDSSSFTLQKKRLAVSEDGKGRQEIVDIVAGKRATDAESSSGFGGAIKKWFGGKKQNEQQNN